jgi:hypothetical protein
LADFFCFFLKKELTGKSERAMIEKTVYLVRGAVLKSRCVEASRSVTRTQREDRRRGQLREGRPAWSAAQ